MPNPKYDATKYMCKYQVDALVLMLEGTSLTMEASNILSIEYVNDYEFNIRAILKVSLRMDVRQKIWILENKRNISAKFELSKIPMDIDSEEFISTPSSVWNNEFVAYFNDDEEATDTENLEARIAKNEGSSFDTSDIESESYTESQNTLDLYLFSQELLNASANVYNEIWTEDLLQQGVARLLKATEHKKVLMSPFENDEVYEELLVPALPAYKALAYLDQYYGFYKTGAMIYYDIDILYILNSNGELTAKQNGEIAQTNIYINRLEESTPGDGMMKLGGDNAYYASMSEMSVNPQKPSIGKNVSLGSEAKIVVTDDTTIDVSAANQSYIDQRNEKIIYTKKDDNKFLPNITKARMEENECIMYVSGNNLDINAFTPNKEYKFIYDETGKQEKYGNSKFRLAYAYHCLKATSDQYMDSSHWIILKKASSGEGGEN